jgi:flagellar protein FliS
MSFAALQYRQARVTTASPVQIVVSLYEGAIRFLREGIAHHEAGDIGRRGVAFSRAHEIVSELIVTLDHERAPEMAENLARLYDFVLRTIVDATSRNDAKVVEPAIAVLEKLASAWREIATRTP